MGCVASNKSNSLQFKINQKMGLLNVTILGYKIQSPNEYSNIEPWIRLKVSNQQYKTKLHKQQNTSKNTLATFDFAINSYNKGYGRVFVIQTLQQDSIDNQIGLGLLDLDQYLQNQCQNVPQRCFINYFKKPAGYINLSLSFKQYPTTTLLFEVNSLFTRQDIPKDRICSARVIIGQEVLQTQPKKQTLGSVPSWKNQALMFRVPSFINKAKIQILEKNQNGKNIVIGDVQIKIQELMKQDQNKLFSQPFYYNNRVKGSISFITSKSIKNIEPIDNKSNKRHQTYQIIKEKQIKPIRSGTQTNMSINITQLKDKQQNNQIQKTQKVRKISLGKKDIQKYQQINQTFKKNDLKDKQVNNKNDKPIKSQNQIQDQFQYSKPLNFQF